MFNNSTKCSLLLNEPSQRANMRTPNESTAARRDDDVLVLLELDLVYNELYLRENKHIRLDRFV